MNAERAHWDAVSGDDPATMIRHGDWADSIRADLAMIDVGGEPPILDLGCGIGRLSVAYSHVHDVDVIGVDVSPAMLARADRDPGVRYLLGDGRTLPDLPMLGGAFSVLMFQHIPKAAQASYVAQVAERLAPGARFVFQTVMGRESAFLSHQVGYGEPIAWACEAGLTVEDVQLGMLDEWLWVSARRPARSAIV